MDNWCSPTIWTIVVCNCIREVCLQACINCVPTSDCIAPSYLKRFAISLGWHTFPPSIWIGEWCTIWRIARRNVSQSSTRTMLHWPMHEMCDLCQCCCIIQHLVFSCSTDRILTFTGLTINWQPSITKSGWGGRNDMNDYRSGDKCLRSQQW